jgi:predicted class III extradiol MEMO1 family dioxygenase
MSQRMATHSGSWYTSNAHQLSKQLNDWLFAVPNEVQPIGAVSSKGGPVRIPTIGARVIIAP